MYCLTFHRRASPRSTRRRRRWSGRWRAAAGEALVVAFTQGYWLSFAVPAAAAVPVVVTYRVGRLWVEKRAVERLGAGRGRDGSPLRPVRTCRGIRCRRQWRQPVNGAPSGHQKPFSLFG
jgi:hypothetical protein